MNNKEKIEKKINVSNLPKVSARVIRHRTMNITSVCPSIAPTFMTHSHAFLYGVYKKFIYYQ